MRILGLVLATVGFFAVAINLLMFGLGNPLALLVWGGVGIVGVLIVVNN